MAKTLHLEIVTPERVVLDQEVEFFSLRAMDGDLGILPNHSPLFAALQPGILKIRTAGHEDYAAVMGGFLEVSNNRATILTDAAEMATNIDVLRAKQAHDQAQIHLSENREVAARVPVQQSLTKAMLRIRASELIRSRRHGGGTAAVPHMEP